MPPDAIHCAIQYSRKSAIDHQHLPKYIIATYH